MSPEGRYLKLSIHLLRGLPLGLFPSISSLKTFLVILSSYILSNLFDHFACLLLANSKIPTAPLKSSFLTLSALLTPSILLSTLICMAWTFDSCCFDKLHASHPCISVGNKVALMTFNMVIILYWRTTLGCRHPTPGRFWLLSTAPALSAYNIPTPLPHTYNNTDSTIASKNLTNESPCTSPTLILHFLNQTHSALAPAVALASTIVLLSTCSLITHPRYLYCIFYPYCTDCSSLER